MDDGTRLPVSRTRCPEINEVALSLLGIGTTLALLTATRQLTPVLVEVLAATILYAWVTFAFRGQTDKFNQRNRLLASYAFVIWFYCAVVRITPALGTTLRDGALLAMDEAMFGQTLPILCERWATPRLTDLMSLCYLIYHVYLPTAVVHALFRSNSSSRQLGVYLFTGFALGFAGYLMVPALGPARAYPELFHAPLVGGPLALLTAEVVAASSSVYDTFPSLHILITCILLDHDWRHVRQRFWIMLLPSLGLMASTVYLRYHYGVDVVAGLVLFLVLRRVFLKIGRREVISGQDQEHGSQCHDESAEDL